MAIGTPVKVIYDDALNAAALAKSQDLRDEVETLAKLVLNQADMDWEDKIDVLDEMPRMRNWSRTFQNNLMKIFRPADEEPEPEP